MTKLKELRAARGISQQELAELVGVSRQTISKWENEVVQPSVDNLMRLSQVLQLPLEAFLRDDWEPPKQQAVEAGAILTKTPQETDTEPAVTPAEAPSDTDAEPAAAPAEAPPESAGEVPPPHRRKYRWWGALAAVMAAVGMIAGVSSFNGRNVTAILERSEYIDMQLINTQLNSMTANYSEAAKWGETPLIQQKAAVTAKNAMTDEYVAKLQEQARKDARLGVGMSEKAIQMQHSQMNQYVSPDRSAMAQADHVLQGLASAEEENVLLQFLDRMLGINAKVWHNSDKQTFVTMRGMAGNCSGKVHYDPLGQTAEIYSSDGEMIASYNSNGAGWTIDQTAAETKFLQESGILYAQAYKAARAEMKYAAQNPAAAGGEAASFNAWA